MPTVPSGLRQAHMPPSSPEDHQHLPVTHGHEPEFGSNGIHPTAPDYSATDYDAGATHVQGAIEEPSHAPDARTALLDDGKKYNIPHLHNCGDAGCGHGAFSPRPRYQRGYGSMATNQTITSDSSREGYGGPYNGQQQLDGSEYRGDFVNGALGDAVTDGLLGRPGKKNTTHWLAKRHGVKHDRWMYVNTITIELPGQQSQFHAHLPCRYVTVSPADS